MIGILYSHDRAITPTKGDTTMKTINAATDQNNTTNYYIDTDGDIHNTMTAATEFGPCVAKVVVDALFVGSAEEMEAAALRKYHQAIK